MKRIFTFLVLMASLSAWGQDRSTLAGKISDTNLNPIPGASVRLLNTIFGAATNEVGEFSIPDIISASYTVEISAVGYATVSREVDLRTAGEPLRIQLVESIRQLDAIVVTAEKKKTIFREYHPALAIYPPDRFSNSGYGMQKTLPPYLPIFIHQTQAIIVT